MRASLWSFLLLVPLLAGCFGTEDHDAEPPDVATAIGEPIVLDHDHTDLSLHTGSYAMEQVAWSSLDVHLGQNGFANFVLWQDDDEKLALVAVDGDTEGGFVIADIADPTHIQVLGRYWTQGNGIQEVRITPDGRYAVMNVQAIPQADWLLDGPECTVCIHVVDIRDRSDPRLVSVLPVELLGTHNMHFEEIDGALYLFYVGQPLLGTNPDPPGNHVWIARWVETPTGGPTLLPVGSLMHDTTNDAGRSFPHDVLVQDHPDGRKIAYVSHWDGGAITFDVTDPTLPQELDVAADPAPSDALAIHWFIQEDAARRDGRVIAWSAPEIGSLATGTGVIRSYDVTDPAAITQLGTWTLPGDLSIEGRFLLSPHTAVPDQQSGLLAVAHYHAGVWLLDMTDPAAPQAVGYFLPHGEVGAPYAGELWWKKPNFSPDGFAPNVFQVRWDPDEAGLLWATERGTGLYLLRYTGDLPGPVR